MQRALIRRHLRAELAEALRESRAVALLGPRQAGKSTLARDLATTDHPAAFESLDEPATLAAALSDPAGFVAGLKGPTVIDEIQRAPGLLLPIKARLDQDDTPGQFLLTGSANLLSLPTVVDALPGRVDYLTLWPLAQSEVHGTAPRLVDELFEGRVSAVTGIPVGREPLANMLITGGYPESLRRSARARTRFFEGYVDSMLGRDLADVATVRNVGSIKRLLSLLAARSGGLANANSIANDLGIDPATVRSHTATLENLFLVRQLPPWHVNLGKRQIKSAKLHVVDSGLLAFLIGADEDRFVGDAGLAGAMLESFVAMELLRLSELGRWPARLYHYRDNAQREVDVIIERNSGDIVGIEVKAGATPSPKDFAGLRFLRDKLGDRFKMGVVLYTGASTLPFGDRMAAVPISGLWSG